MTLVKLKKISEVKYINLFKSPKTTIKIFLVSIKNHSPEIKVSIFNNKYLNRPLKLWKTLKFFKSMIFKVYDLHLSRKVLFIVI